MGARKLIKQGILLKTKSGRKLQAFLCSDILVLTDELARTLYRMVSGLLLVCWGWASFNTSQPIPLAHAHVMGEPKGVFFLALLLTDFNCLRFAQDDCTFKITQAYPRGGDSISLKALSARDCQRQFCTFLVPQVGSSPLIFHLEWIQEIDTSGRRCRHAEERAARKSAHRR